MIPIPSELGKWSISNKGELFGVLKNTQSMHFDDGGYASVSPKGVSLRSTVDSADFGLPLKVLYYNSRYFILTSQQVWTLGSDFTWTCISDAESDAPDPNAGSDAVVWQGRVYVSSGTSTDIRYWGGSSWTNPSIALTTDAVPHPMAVFGQYGANGALVFGDKNLIKVVDTAHAVQATLTLNEKYTVTGLLIRDNFIFIATKSTEGGDARLFKWNGTGTVYQADYGVGSDWIFAIKEYGASFVVVTNTGQILRWNGGGFDTENPLAVFPVNNSPYRWTSVISSLVGKVHMNGVAADGEVLYINIDGTVANPFTLDSTTYTDSFPLPNQPSGVWCYDPNVGLYHRDSQTTDAYTSFSASSLSSNTLTLSAATNAATGEPIHCQENGSLTGISDDTTYYIIKVASNQVKLALNRADAVAGTAITLGGSVTSAVFYIVNYDQYGQLVSLNADPGCIGLVETDSVSPTIFPEIFRTLYVWGFTATGGNAYLNGQTKGSGIGFMSINRVYSSSVKQIWQKLITRFKDLFLATDKLIVRYRTRDRADFPTALISGTFSNSDTIGSASPLIDQAEVGDTVVFVSGNGAGNRRKITSKDGDELSLNEEIVGAVGADAIVFYIEPLKTAQIADKNTETVSEGYIQSSLDISTEKQSSIWVDLQVEARGQIKIPQLQLLTAPNK